jgi:FdrA protein
VTAIRNEVRKGFYLDSVALMRAARSISRLADVEEAGLMIGTAGNKEILRAAGVLDDAGARAGPGDLIIAVRARHADAAETALAEARRLLDRPLGVALGGSTWRPRTLRGAIQQLPNANLALISVPGDFAAAEARKALRRGLHAMIFSDNVPVGDEVTLKRKARDLGLFVMGPDCGTAIIAGTPVGFANAVPQGDIGIIGASGTGIQEVTCLIANAGRGISHAIGTGGRDLSAEVGGISTLAALDLLERDSATKQIVLVSKPAPPEVSTVVYARASKSTKPMTLCIIGGATEVPLPANLTSCGTLQEAAEVALGCKIASYRGEVKKPNARGRLIRGLFCGGTLCSEAQVVLRRTGRAVASNAPIPGAERLGERDDIDALVDLGDDAFTRGRPHPMIEPVARHVPIAQALADDAVGALLVDVILGWGSHPDPAGELVRGIAGRPRGGPAIIASVVGTEADPQVRSVQVKKLVDAGVIVAPSNAAATALALACLQ